MSRKGLLLLLVTFLSGVCALTYQIIWTRLFSLVLGATTLSINIVIGSFMAGLAIGSWLFSKNSGRIKSPLTFYGLIEIGIGIYSFLLPYLITFSNQTLLQLCRQSSLETQSILLAQMGLSFGLMIIPTAFMGMTLPLLTQIFCSEAQSLGKSIGRLYLLNTLGAALGCFLCGFVLIGNLGITYTLNLTASINIGLGVVSLLLGYRAKASKNSETQSQAENPSDVEDYPKNLGLLLLVVTFISGFVGLAYELVWIRLFQTFLLGSSIYALTSVVTTVLIGIALGSWIFTKILKSQKQDLTWVSILQMVFGVTSIISIIGIFYVQKHGLQTVLSTTDRFGISVVLKFFVVPFLILIIPATLMGMNFPLIAKIYCANRDTAGRQMGFIFMSNTLGAILGTWITGFLLFKWLGCGGASLCLSIFIIASGTFIAPKRVLSVAGVVIISILTWIAVQGDFVKQWVRTNAYGDPIERWIEGSTVIAWGSNSTERCKSVSRQLDLNGRSISATRIPGERYMKLMAHLPILFHPNPKDALVICFGTGMTVGAASLHSQLNQVDCVDISEEVLQMGDYFSDWNHQISEKAKLKHTPQINLIVEDGRTHLLRNSHNYDIITLEPPPPTDAGVVSLYSKEFYQLCHQNLTDDGLVAQWIPIHCQSFSLCLAEMKTFISVFPSCSLWLPTASNIVIIGQKKPSPIHFNAISNAIQKSPLRENLHKIGIDDPEDLFSLFFMGPKGIQALTSNNAVIQDNNPLPEYFFNDRLAPTEEQQREINLIHHFFQQRENYASFFLPANNESPISPSNLFRLLNDIDYVMLKEIKSLPKSNISKWESYLRAYEMKPDNLWFQELLQISDLDIKFYEDKLASADSAQRETFLSIIKIQQLLRQRDYALANQASQRAINQNPKTRELWNYFLLSQTAMRLNLKPPQHNLSPQTPSPNTPKH